VSGSRRASARDDSQRREKYLPHHRAVFLARVEGYAVKPGTICVSFVVPTAAVETREFTHKGVEAPRRLAHFAQSKMSLHRSDAGPQKKSQMREIAALQNCVQNVRHMLLSAAEGREVIQERA
jgi:hypothetical protein